MSGGRCDLCHAVVVWVRVPSGTRIPLEAIGDGMPKAYENSPGRGRIQEQMKLYRLDGDVQVVDEIVVTIVPEAGTPDPELPIWRSHYAVSCKGVRQRRRRRWV